MKSIADAIKKINPNAEVIVKETTIDDVDSTEIIWLNNTPEISKEDIKTALAEIKADEENLVNLKASAKAKLVAGEPLTEAEADTLVI
tara:strand:+ start:890 stop:1153 length:264 start_codon:yes stop_codon:yes gene_type:complete